MKTLLTVTCVLLACHSVRAGDTPAAAAKAAPVVDLKAGAARLGATTTGTSNTDYAGIYAPKNKSVFTASANDHNPFWPIGWTKTEALSSTEEAAPVNPHVDDFSVTTIMLNDPPMAVINGKDMAEGEVAALNVNGRAVVVQLMAVQDGRVVIRWQNQNLVIPIHRDEQLSAVPVQTSADNTSAADGSTTTALR